MLNLVMKAALGTIRTADIRAARKAWGVGLTDADVQAVYTANLGKLPEIPAAPPTIEDKQANGAARKNIEMQNNKQVAVRKKKGKKPTSKAEQDSITKLNDSEYFTYFQQKIIGETVAERDFKEYTRRFGKDMEAIKINYRKFTLQYKNKLITPSKYAELNFMAKAALGTLTPADLKAVRGVWCDKLTDKDVEEVFAQNNIMEDQAETTKIEGEKDKIAVAEAAADDSEEKDTDLSEASGKLNDSEYFAAFQQKVIDDAIRASDMREYARRFGRDPEGIKDNLRLFTMQYRNNLISGEKFAEVNFMSKAALGIATAIDRKAARGAWGGGLTYKDVQAILTQKNK
jgi:hypothetical protein